MLLSPNCNLHVSIICTYHFCWVPSLKLTWHLKMDGWNTIVSFWCPAYFQVRTVGFREGIFSSPYLQPETMVGHGLVQLDCVSCCHRRSSETRRLPAKSSKLAAGGKEIGDEKTAKKKKWPKKTQFQEVSKFWRVKGFMQRNTSPHNQHWDWRAPEGFKVPWKDIQ